MRDILFRGFQECENGNQQVFINGTWHKGKWVYGLLARYDPAFECSNIIDEFGLLIPVVTETVGQFTGLYDDTDWKDLTLEEKTLFLDSKDDEKVWKGKPIFDGDIIAYTEYDEYRRYLESCEHPKDFTSEDFSEMWTLDEVVYGIEIGYPAFDLKSHNFESNGLSELSESGQFYYCVVGTVYDKPLFNKKT